MAMMTLKAARTNKGLCQMAAASEIGVSKKTLSNWENGKTFPDVPQIEKICEVYGVTYNDLIFLPSNPL